MQSNQLTTAASRSKLLARIGIVAAFVVLLGISAMGLVLQQRQSQDEKRRSQRLEQRIAALETEDTFAANEVAKDRYQAVFLTNGQVYFGKITKITEDTIKIEDIFYLNDGSVDSAGNATSSTAALVKLGDELHGPDDAMILERKNVTFWENLKSDGGVAKAIDEYKQSH